MLPSCGDILGKNVWIYVYTHIVDTWCPFQTHITHACSIVCSRQYWMLSRSMITSNTIDIPMLIERGEARRRNTTNIPMQFEEESHRPYSPMSACKNSSKKLLPFFYLWEGTLKICNQGVLLWCVVSLSRIFARYDAIVGSEGPHECNI